MLYFFDTQRAIEALVAGGVPRDQALTMTQVWLEILQDFQISTDPTLASLRQTAAMGRFETELRKVQRLLEKRPRDNETP